MSLRPDEMQWAHRTCQTARAHRKSRAVDNPSAPAQPFIRRVCSKRPQHLLRHDARCGVNLLATTVPACRAVAGSDRHPGVIAQKPRMSGDRTRMSSLTTCQHRAMRRGPWRVHCTASALDEAGRAALRQRSSPSNATAGRGRRSSCHVHATQWRPRPAGRLIAACRADRHDIGTRIADLDVRHHRGPTIAQSRQVRLGTGVHTPITCACVNKADREVDSSPASRGRRRPASGIVLQGGWHAADVDGRDAVRGRDRTSGRR